jgi:hypothetical protein
MNPMNFVRFVRQLPPGRAWAYLGVLMGFSLSITANVAETVLTETPISLALRLPFAIAWPALTYVAIEVLTRTLWARFAWNSGQSWAHLITRLVLWVPVGGVAAYSSYLHQSHLFFLGGEPSPIVTFGPLAVDGMLFGCTATLIITKVVRSIPRPLSIDEEFMTLAEAMPISPAVELEEAPVSPAPVRATRAPRAQWDAARVVGMIADGEITQVIVDATGAGRASVDRMRKVHKMLKADPRAVIDARAEKVPAEYVSMIRELALR